MRGLCRHARHSCRGAACARNDSLNKKDQRERQPCDSRRLFGAEAPGNRNQYTHSGSIQQLAGSDRRLPLMAALRTTGFRLATHLGGVGKAAMVATRTWAGIARMPWVSTSPADRAGDRLPHRDHGIAILRAIRHRLMPPWRADPALPAPWPGTHSRRSGRDRSSIAPGSR
jgi:hypothetical protein